MELSFIRGGVPIDDRLLLNDMKLSPSFFMGHFSWWWNNDQKHVILGGFFELATLKSRIWWPDLMTGEWIQPSALFGQTPWRLLVLRAKHLDVLITVGTAAFFEFSIGYLHRICFRYRFQGYLHSTCWGIATVFPFSHTSMELDGLGLFHESSVLLGRSHFFSHCLVGDFNILHDSFLMFTFQSMLNRLFGYDF